MDFFDFDFVKQHCRFLSYKVVCVARFASVTATRQTKEVGYLSQSKRKLGVPRTNDMEN
jgi:hypothetical protein